MKTTKLPSVEEIQDKMSSLRAKFVSKKIGYAKWANGVDKLLTQRDHQAYTSLVEGIEGMTYAMNVDEYLELVEKWEGENYDQPFDDGYAQALKDIRENVVKPLYGKE